MFAIRGAVERRSSSTPATVDANTIIHHRTSAMSPRSVFIELHSLLRHFAAFGK
jgi:hypothetical protein